MSNSGEVVTSVGNSWIICRSKTQAGRIYYFNTFTGEAVWNLNVSEIEKAKKRTHLLVNESNFQIDNCPEPMHSPTDNSKEPMCSKKISTQKVTPSKVYNKQIINNQFGKTPFPYPPQLAHYGSLNPLQFGLPPINQGVWNITPPQIFIPSEVVNPSTSVIRQTMNTFDYVPVTNTSVPLSSRFKSQGRSDSVVPLHPNRIEVNQSDAESSFGTRNFNNKMSRNMDLRLILSKKRKVSNTDFNTNEFNESSSHLQLACDNDDDDENSLKDNYKTVSPDVTSLKKLLRIEDEFQVWYIVTDSNVFLNNINFINTLLDSDSQCRLMVPQIVMDKIQSAANTRLRTRAHRAAYFISQKIDANIAVIDKGNLKQNCDYKDQIINCCVHLTDQEYHVIMLTDDIEIHNVENSLNFPIFTVRELKNILHNVIPTPRPIDISPDKFGVTQNRSIKITISNDANAAFKHEHNNIEENDSLSKINLNTKLPNDNITKNKSDQLVESNTLKQTDVINKKTDDETELKTQSVNEDKIENSSISHSMKISQTLPGIPLKRSCSYDNHSKPENKSVRNYNKWHRCKSKSSLSIYSKSSTISETESTNGINDNIRTYEQPAINISCQVSTESHHNPTNDNNYENSSDSGSVKRCSFVKHVVINETSSESSNMESIETSKEHNQRPEGIVVDVNNVEKNVMFEVTSLAMEECLRTKCDEWISRFIQIMEEAMSQILQQDPPFILDTMLPPWTIYEAAECVKRKFHYDHDVVDAATKLLNVLFGIGGLRGKIKMDISPNKYMEVYSYGVYLIDALQGLFNTSEDLQTAAESLSKLLSDIQDSHLNTSIQDSFNDVPSESVVNLETLNDSCIGDINVVPTDNEQKVDRLDKSELIDHNLSPQNSTPTRKSQQKVAESVISTPGKYNLRSQRKTTLPEKEKTPESVTFIRNIDLKSSFFTNLDLKKKSSEKNESINEMEFDNCSQETINNGNNELNEDTTEAEQKKTNEQRVIRNFTCCPEFENKLKLKNQTDKITFDSWTFKRGDNYEDESGPDYNAMAEQYYGNDYDNSYEINEMYDTEEMYDESFNDRVSEFDDQVDNEIPKNDIQFKDIIVKIENNIKQALSSIYEFCQQSHSKLNSESSSVDKIEIRKLAENTLVYLNDLCGSFRSILARESSNSMFGMQELFSLEEFQDIVLEEGNLEYYRNFIGKCAEQGNILKDSVELIIEASKQ